jgi:hypothetical protein
MVLGGTKVPFLKTGGPSMPQCQETVGRIARYSVVPNQKTWLSLLLSLPYALTANKLSEPGVCIHLIVWHVYRVARMRDTRVLDVPGAPNTKHIVWGQIVMPEIHFSQAERRTKPVCHSQQLC